MSQEIERELGWDDEIEESGPEFVLLPEGEYNFTVEKFERSRHQGSANLPPCNMAILTLKIDGGEHGEATVIHRLFLHSKTEGFLSRFFESIGQKKEGERIRMNWNAVFGAKGRCKLEINTYMKDGQERKNNQIKSFLPYSEYLKHAGNEQFQTPTQQQPFPTSQTMQQPFPTNTPSQQQGGFTPGQF
ncbi:hypothetical protein LI012_06330 [Caldibacillus thermoamylovorans]|uniref:hypothetical protein n=1 Tax=Caldibacillus thermoamylovorans TaxID=35841 RepID=UPI001D08D38D|nr:hypothetical protein [Caldibacillus thermoamylovorans]MCB5934469.1 hypothetical protein [Bacillus sp. DFI.2.34]MCB7076444.1 hypothetical protein [Caldibacillus thermoamylovorans]